MIALVLVAVFLAAVPAVMLFVNLRLYRPAPMPGDDIPAISVLIPARNEEASITAAVEAALASRHVDIEVIVLDDHSEDGTARLVRSLGEKDPRVRLLAAPELPPGWCGKQHACHVLAGAARMPLLVFLDADVRLGPDGLARLAAFQRESDADLVSGVPHQETGTLLEKLLIPLIHFVLLGFLPLSRMRRYTSPSYAAGCGQLFLARRAAYEQVGGHAAIRTTLHDGIRLPRAFRAADKKTDLCDATDLASCRMYRGAAEVWRGLAKNAIEGLAAPGRIVPATVFLLGGQVLPFGLLAASAWLSPLEIALAALAALLAYAPRIQSALRFRQSALGAALHPVGVLLLVSIQWYALLRRLVGRPATWKGRSYKAAKA